MEQPQKLDPLTEIALRGLRDIAVPEPVSWMPQTWGWLALALVLLAALVTWAAFAYRRWQRNAYRREALKLLDGVATGMRSPDGQQQAVTALGELMKRTALAAWPREMVAPVSGADWASFLAAQGGDMGDSFEVFFDDLEYRPRKPMTAEVADDLILSARRWIEGHHVSA